MLNQNSDCLPEVLTQKQNKNKNATHSYKPQGRYVSQHESIYNKTGVSRQQTGYLEEVEGAGCQPGTSLLQGTIYTSIHNNQSQ